MGVAGARAGTQGRQTIEFASFGPGSRVSLRSPGTRKAFDAVGLARPTKRNARESRAIVLEHAGQLRPNYVKPEGKAWSIITHASVGWSCLEWLRRKTRHYPIACRASELRLLVPCCGKVRCSRPKVWPPRR